MEQIQKQTHFRVWKSGKKWLYGATVLMLVGTSLAPSIMAFAGTVAENGASLTVPDSAVSLFTGESLTASQFGVSASGSGVSGTPTITGIDPSSAGSQTATVIQPYSYQVMVPAKNLENAWPIRQQQIRTSLTFVPGHGTQSIPQGGYFALGQPWNNGVGGHTTPGYYYEMDEVDNHTGVFAKWMTSANEAMFNSDTNSPGMPVSGWVSGGDFLGAGLYGSYNFTDQTQLDPQLSYHAQLTASGNVFKGFVIPFSVASFGLGDIPGVNIQEIQTTVNAQVSKDLSAGQTPTVAELTGLVKDYITSHWKQNSASVNQNIGGLSANDGNLFGVGTDAFAFDNTTTSIDQNLSALLKITTDTSTSDALETYVGTVFVTWTPATTTTVSGTLKSQFPVNYFVAPTLSAAPDVVMFASDSLATKDTSASVVDSLSAIDSGTLTSSLVSSSLGIPSGSLAANSSSAVGSLANSGQVTSSASGTSLSANANSSAITLPAGSSAAATNVDGTQLSYHSASNGSGGEAHTSTPVSQLTAPGVYVIGYDYHYTNPGLGTAQDIHKEQTIKVYPDPSLTAPADQKLQVGDLYTQSSASVSDVASSFDKGSLTVDSSKVNTSAAGTYPVNVVYNYFDPYTNSTKTVTVQQHVEVDAKAPAPALPDTGDTQDSSAAAIKVGVVALLVGLAIWQRKRIVRWIEKLKKEVD